MKSISLLALLFVIGGVGMLFAFSLSPGPDLENWTIEDEETVSHLPICPEGKIPEGNWGEIDPKDWPCRIDILLTTTE